MANNQGIITQFFPAAERGRALGQLQSLGFTNPLILIGISVSIVASIAFILVEQKGENSLIPLDILRTNYFR